MANPRKVIGHEGIGYRAETFLIDGSTIVWAETEKNGSAVAGRAVGLVVGTANVVELVDTGDQVLGRLDNVAQDGACTVQIEGQCFLPQGDGDDVVRGGKIVGAQGVGGALGFIAPPSADAAGALAARHRVEDDTTATAISVYLGV